MSRLRVSRSHTALTCRKGLLLAVCLALAGCELIGPDFRKPDSETGSGWLDARDGRLSHRSPDHRAWWKTFSDPVLDQLIQAAYRQNLSLRDAIEASALTLAEGAAERLGLSNRGFTRAIRVARSIADLAGADMIARAHVAEALAFRNRVLARA